jgi:Cu(I)/Ag(I) efflux system periplasmic protein CusF
MSKSHLSGAAKTATILALAAGLSAELTGMVVAAETPLAPSRQSAQADDKPSGVGTINSVDAAKRKLMIAHGPIAALQWPGMTMAFTVAPEINLGALKPGAKIAFTLIRGADSAYVIDQIRPAK